MLNVSRNERSNRLIYQITIDLHELFSNRAWLNIRRSRGVSILRLENHFSSSQRRLSFGFSIDRCIARKRRVNGFRSIRGCRFVSSFVILIDRSEEERNREFFWLWGWPRSIHPIEKYRECLIQVRNGELRSFVLRNLYEIYIDNV